MHCREFERRQVLVAIPGFQHGCNCDSDQVEQLAILRLALILMTIWDEPTPRRFFASGPP